jgi:hypothetical protein
VLARINNGLAGYISSFRIMGLILSKNKNNGVNTFISGMI